MRCPCPKCNHPKDFTEEELQEHFKCSHMGKIFKGKSEQDYTKTMLPPENDNRIEMIEVNEKLYPSCKKHGAMIAYKEAYRCVECGFAVLRKVI